jgi:molybdopterin-guanine dinucleotide biosynthesis adapter protein
VAKDTHHRLELDRPGKDSYRLAAAGAARVILTGPGQLALFGRTSQPPTLRDLASLVEPDADLLLAEGFRDEPEPALIVWRAALGRDWPALSGPVVALVSDDPIGSVPEAGQAASLPRFGFAAVEELADFLLR